MDKGSILLIVQIYISSGCIDLHVHAFPSFNAYGDDINEIRVKQEVTMIVEVGRCGTERISDLIARGE